MRHRLRSIIRKEFIPALRDPRMRGMIVSPPLIQLLVFGYAVNLDVDTARIAWMDQDRTPQSRDLRAAFESSGHFTIGATPDDEHPIQSVPHHAQMAEFIPALPGFAPDITPAP